MTVRSAISRALRFGLGARVGAHGAPQQRVPELYEFEQCPFCRKVREALVHLDLDADMRPCPPGGTRYRQEVVRRGGKAQFPFLVDGDDALYESDAIIKRLAARHGDGRVPLILRLGPLTTLTGGLVSLLHARPWAAPSQAPARPLELFADEASEGARAVRSLLCALELPYRWRTCGEGSAKRDELRARTGSDELPALFDPNTGATLQGEGPALAHLRATYGL